MSKITSLIRRAPKRFSLTVAVIAAAIIVPAAAFAWGPNRETFTIANPSDHVQFNSITDNPNIGDERNFVGIREVGSANTWYDDVTAQPGKEYYVRMYVHNNAADSLGLVAKDVTAKFTLPTTTSKSVQVNGFLSASNVGADKNGNNGQYAEVYDHATFNSDTNFNLAYVSGSLKYENNAYGAAGTTLPESIFTSAGAKLGYDKLDGNIPGCFKYAGYVTFKVKPQFAETINFETSKLVSKHGENKWVESYKAQPGETVDYLIKYKNTGTSQANDVTFRDTLPAGMTYVNGSTTYGNSKLPNGAKASDNITNGTGINVGAYAPGANAWAIFSAKVPANDALKECGTNKLVNVAKVTTGGYSKDDDATVTVDKTCKPVVKYTCDSLVVNRVGNERTKFKFTTTYTVENAVFNSVTYVIRNANGIAVDTLVNQPAVIEYTQSTVGNYTVQAIVNVTVNGEKKTVESDSCKAKFEVPAQPEYCEVPGKEHLPKNSPDCVTTPPVTPPTTPPTELPHTGITENIVALVGLGSLIASIGYYVASRRALS